MENFVGSGTSAVPFVLLGVAPNVPAPLNVAYTEVLNECLDEHFAAEEEVSDDSRTDGDYHPGCGSGYLDSFKGKKAPSPSKVITWDYVKDMNVRKRGLSDVSDAFSCETESFDDDNASVFSHESLDIMGAGVCVGLIEKDCRAHPENLRCFYSCTDYDSNVSWYCVDCHEEKLNLDGLDIHMAATLVRCDTKKCRARFDRALLRS